MEEHSNPVSSSRPLSRSRQRTSAGDRGIVHNPSTATPKARSRCAASAGLWEWFGPSVSLDVEIQDMVRKGDRYATPNHRRQTNIRRIASELARKRMVAMMQHVAIKLFRSGVNPSMAHELPSIDWQRHDPAEKAYHALQMNVDRFKKEIDWLGMQQGLPVRCSRTSDTPGNDAVGCIC